MSRFFIARDAQRRRTDDVKSTAESTKVETTESDLDNIAATILMRNNI